AAAGVPDKTIGAYRPVLDNLLGLISGRVYYNINNWYRALLLLPSFGRNKDDMERMMGLDTPVDFVEDQILSRGEKLRRLPRMGITLARLMMCFSGLDRRVRRFLRRFDARLAKYDRAAIANAPWSE